MAMINDDVQTVKIGPRKLEGLLGHTVAAKGLVIFAHGSGSGRLSPRNNFVAAGLRKAGCATLLLDLLQPEEETDRANVFDIPLLAGRLSEAMEWAGHQEKTAQLPIGLFGASTGAGAALVAAAHAEREVAAIVSRGGRPDLAGESLSRVTAPTLLIVGSLDTPVIALNRQALSLLRGEKDMAIVNGASHLFEEPGTLEQVVALASDWFVEHFTRKVA
jgi:putative phosphoribosyl transferase